MNFLVVVVVAIVCFGAGWFFGIGNLKNIEQMAEGVEQAAEFMENMETPDIDMMNITLNQNRDAKASLDIRTLLDLEKGDMDSAKERLINTLASDYLDIKEDDAHEMRSLESADVIKKIDSLSKEHQSFKKVIKESGWVE